MRLRRRGGRRGRRSRTSCIIDEINRGNLPRIFGELLYLLEYREPGGRLPYSRRGFRLPANLYLLGTMNAADRSVGAGRSGAAAAASRSWRCRRTPACWRRGWRRTSAGAGPAFAGGVLGLFERLNARLRADLGPQAQVGHSYFMVPDLDEARLRLVWQHHVRPLLDEYFAGQPGRAAAYDLERLLAPPARAGKARPAPAPG